MKKLRILIVTIVVMAIVSCAGYLTNGDSGANGNTVDTLSLVSDSNKFVSSDTKNDITPFLYRETNGNNPVLFFASDRDGSYDIWLAKMSNNGQFFTPEKMTNLSTAPELNTANNEWSPVVFRYSGGLYISFLRLEGGGTNLYTYMLDGDMKATNGDTYVSVSANSIGLYYYGPDTMLYAANGTTSYSNYSFEQGSGWYEDSTGTTDIPVYSASGFQEYTYILSIDYTSEYKIFDAITNGKHQLYMYVGYSATPGGNIVNSEFISDYRSTYNDKDPMIDYYDPAKKVYFSSDRTGVYDLYRYNTTTFTNVVPEKPAWMNGY